MPCASSNRIAQSPNASSNVSHFAPLFDFDFKLIRVLLWSRKAFFAERISPAVEELKEYPYLVCHQVEASARVLFGALESKYQARRAFF
jgi:hypothetical protein